MQLNSYNQNDSSEELSRQILSATRADQDEIEAAVNSPFLFQRIRNQIATEGNQTHHTAVANHRNLFSAFFASFNWRWGWAIPAAALLLFGFVMLMTKSNSEKFNETVKQTTPEKIVTPEKIAPLAKSEPSDKPEIKDSASKVAVVKANHRPAAKRSENKISRSPIANETAEVVTDFLPLTYLSESSAADSGHVVRVEVPRTMMASMGVPTNRERKTEFVKADVIIGDDGLATAIRFVQ
jgi:hypothetical protein